VAPFHCLTFLTDYGLEDGFVAACHGVAFQIAPNTPITDITHLVPPGDIQRGAVVLAQTVRYFPPAVHVAVVDPGVGTERRGVAVAAGGSVFVGPDNGLLSWAVAEAGGATAAVSLTNRALWRDTVTATFHGRDIFMPAAAHLAAGTPLARAGDALDVASLVTLPRPESGVRAGGSGGSGGPEPPGWEGYIEAEVLTVDRFGNAQLSVTGADAARAGLVPGARVTLAWDGHERTVAFGSTFGDVAAGEIVGYPDSAGYVAIAVNGGSAVERLGLRQGTRVTLTITK
jgi:S-adenosyl-L-methionine hydrolase (adenosine-forming)